MGMLAYPLVLERQDEQDNEGDGDSTPQVNGVVIYGALTGALVFLFLVFVLILFLQRRRQRQQFLNAQIEDEAARRRRRRRKRRAGLRTHEIDAVAPEMVVGGEWESTSDEAGDVEMAEVSTVAKLGSVEDAGGGRKREVLDLEEEVVCAVCLEELAGGDVVRRLPCEHIFHSVCIHRWAKRANKCPCCLRTIAQKRRRKPPAEEGEICENEANNGEGGGDDNPNEGSVEDIVTDASEGGTRTAVSSSYATDHTALEGHPLSQPSDQVNDSAVEAVGTSSVIDIGEDDVSLASLTMNRSDAARMLDEVRRELRDPDARPLSNDHSAILDDYAAQPVIPVPPPVARFDVL